MVATATFTCMPLLYIMFIFLSTQLFETVKGMPAFMLNNGLLKVICQLISIVTDYAQLTTEGKELILNDVHQLCKLVVIFAIRSVQLLLLTHCCSGGMFDLLCSTKSI